MISAVHRTIEAAPWAVRWRINTPRRAARLPQRGVNGLLIAGFKREVDGAGVFVFEKDALPRLAAIIRAENTALGICSVGMAQGCDEQTIGIVGIDQDATDLACILEADVRPRLPAVGRLVQAISARNRRAHVGFARANVNHVMIGSCNGDGADRSDRLRIKNRIPSPARVIGFPHASAHGTKIVVLQFAANTGYAENATRAEWSDGAPLQFFEKV